MNKVKDKKFEIESIVVKKSSRHKIGSSQDIDPDLDAEFLVEEFPTKEQALKVLPKIANRDKKISMWNVLTLQEYVYDYEEDSRLPYWIAVGDSEEFFISDFVGEQSQ
jgi:hypothetical protein